MVNLVTMLKTKRLRSGVILIKEKTRYLKDFKFIWRIGKSMAEEKTFTKKSKSLFRTILYLFFNVLRF